MLRAGSRIVRSPLFLLGVVSVLHAISPLVLVGVHHGFGSDETVYLSQINGSHPATIFSAPRARGLTLLVAPVTVWTSSVPVVRLWLAFLTGVGTFVAFRPWLRLTNPYVVPLAALLFSSLWTTIYYGFEAMPNIYVAYSAVFAVACVLRYRQGGQRRWLAGLFVSMVLLALLRPSDAGYVFVPLFVAAMVLRGLARRDRAWIAGTALLGLVAGAAEWAVEAYVRFGGLLNRVHLAEAEQGKPGALYFSLGKQADVLTGPLLCRGGCHAHAPWWALVWWFAIPVLVAVALFVWRRRPAVMVLPTVVGLALAAEYLVSVGYGAPRFLTPVYALLALPSAVGLVAAVRWLSARAGAPAWRAAVVVGAAAVVLAQIGSQVHIVQSSIVPSTRGKVAEYVKVGEALRAQLPLHQRPCLIAGHDSNPVAFAARCSSYPATPAGLIAADDAGTDVIWLSRHRRLPAPIAHWDTIALTGTGGHSWYAAVEPPAT
ncbi:MAG TPA: hypothetical protein VFT62_03415 [Mycobacteriales bacterium]|nr:hypothetical protein [Mycobacteriales bacterium]